MYIANSIMEGLKILGFDKETIKSVSKEKSLEEIFLSTLFINYFIVLIVFLMATIMGNVQISGRELNLPVFFGILMVYPFAFNVVVYMIYGFFGLVAEMLNKRNHVKPLISVGFHTAIVYSILIYVIALLSTFNIMYGFFLLSVFGIYFLLTMFLSISIIYNYSAPQSLIILFIPLLIISLIGLLVLYFVDLRTILAWILV